jgi:hypothetical protein
MNIINLLNKKRNIANRPFSFDTKSDTPSNNAFTIRRESDDAEQTFSYTQINDGTFDTFVAGSEGAVTQWFGSDGSVFRNTNKANQPRLKSGVDNPYVDDYYGPAVLARDQTLNLSGDYIVSCILKEETNNNNGRINFGLRGSGSNAFGVQLQSTGDGYIIYNRVVSGNPDYNFTWTNDANFKLFTFTSLSGVLSLYINNVEITLNAGGGWTTSTASLAENQVLLGNTQYNGGGGKVTKYQHLGVVVGETATNMNISDYNTFLMVRYGM